MRLENTKAPPVPAALLHEAPFICPVLMADQVAYILSDCNVRVLVTSRARYDALVEALARCTDLHHAILICGPLPHALFFFEIHELRAHA
jgi:hypothetical protein